MKLYKKMLMLIMMGLLVLPLIYASILFDYDFNSDINGLTRLDNSGIGTPTFEGWSSINGGSYEFKADSGDEGRVIGNQSINLTENGTVKWTLNITRQDGSSSQFMLGIRWCNETISGLSGIGNKKNQCSGTWDDLNTAPTSWNELDGVNILGVNFWRFNITQVNATYHTLNFIKGGGVLNQINYSMKNSQPRYIMFDIRTASGNTGFTSYFDNLIMEDVSIINNPPIVTWINFSVLNNTLQSETELNLYINISDSDTDFVNFTIYNKSFELITVNNFNTSGTFILNISDEARYKLNISVTDGVNNVTSLVLDVIIDRTNGTITGLTNMDSPPFAFVNEDIRINTTCQDNNLFGCNINITLDGVEKYFDERTGITDTIITLSNITQFTESGIYTVTRKVSDDHTINKIKNYAITTALNKITFNNEVTIETVGAEMTKRIPTTYKKIDRYSIDFGLTSGVHLFKISSRLPISYRQTSKYKGHLVIGEGLGKYWYDMENVEGAKVELYEIGADYIIFRTMADSFNSIGGVNINTDVQSLIVRERGDTMRMTALDFQNQTLTAKNVWVSLGLVELNITAQEDINFLGTWNAQKVTGDKEITGMWRIVFDGVPISNISRTIQIRDNASISLLSQVDNVAVGLHNISFEQRKEHIGSAILNPMLTKNIHWAVIQPKSSNETINHKHQKLTGISITNNILTPIINISYNSNFESEVFVSATFEITSTAITNTTILLQLNKKNGCSAKRSHKTSNSIGVITMGCIFNYSDSLQNNLTVFAKSSNGISTVNSHIIMYTLGINKTVSNNFKSEVLFADNSVSISSSVPILISNLSINVTTVNGTILVMGSSTVTDTNNVVNMMISVDNFQNHTTTRLISNTDIGNIAVLHVMRNLSLGVHNLKLYGWGNTASAINFINYSFFGFEGINIKGEQIITSPTINIDFPINNSNISFTFINGTCSDFSGISDVVSLNTSWVFNDSSTVLGWRFDYNLNVSGNQTFGTTITCINPFGLTANKSVQWNFIFIEENVTTITQPIFTFRTLKLDLNVVLYLLLLFLIGVAIVIYSEMIVNTALIMGSGLYFIFYGLFLLLVTLPFALIILGVGLCIFIRGVHLALIFDK